MDGTTLLMLIAAFVVAISIIALAGIRVQRDIVGICGVIAILLAVVLGYFGCDYLMGRPKPVGAFVGWGQPTLPGDGATVLGGAVDGDTAYMLLDEGTGGPPRLYGFPNSDEMRSGIKTAMQNQSEKQRGNPWGFKMTAKGANSEKDGQGQGQKRDGSGQHQGNGNGNAPADDVPYAFSAPQPRVYHDKTPMK